eukprot:TRINITY_DN3896_c0_g1_i6.p1 TRINITY_DN3896_c0_g1~~TRINITY_DN3896_c0_g1_i6.p1  ORF type:complete len:244 (+),score=67.16 TRINITY_DN3896_c0_g1_i6:71-733(+)
MRVQQIRRTATLAWCQCAPLLACGTLVGTMSETFDPTGTLEIFDVDANPKATFKTEEKMYKLAWSGESSLSHSGLGIIAGGLESGTIGLWNPSILLEGVNDPLLSSQRKHIAAVRGLDFNPLKLKPKYTIPKLKHSKFHHSKLKLITNLPNSNLPNPKTNLLKLITNLPNINLPDLNPLNSNPNLGFNLNINPNSNLPQLQHISQQPSQHPFRHPSQHPS